MTLVSEALPIKSGTLGSSTPGVVSSIAGVDSAAAGDSSNFVCSRPPVEDVCCEVSSSFTSSIPSLP